jgi:hypothetical protein
MWNATLNYGLEASKSKFPLFFAVSIPIHDIKNPAPDDNQYDAEPMKQWDGPDWKDFLQQWTVGIGVKSAMF